MSYRSHRFVNEELSTTVNCLEIIDQSTDYPSQQPNNQIEASFKTIAYSGSMGDAEYRLPGNELSRRHHSALDSSKRESSDIPSHPLPPTPSPRRALIVVPVTVSLRSHVLVRWVIGRGSREEGR